MGCVFGCFWGFRGGTELILMAGCLYFGGWLGLFSVFGEGFGGVLGGFWVVFWGLARLILVAGWSYFGVWLGLF